MIAELPANESQRLRELRAYAILDTPEEHGFDDVTALAASICGIPIALITLIDESRQWFKSKIGIEIAETARDVSFCSHALNDSCLMVVPDAELDERFAGYAQAMGEPEIRFYAGAPLVTQSGAVLGTLCVIDRIPRELTPLQLTALRVLGQQVMNLIQSRHDLGELRKTEVALLALLEERDGSEREQRQLVHNLTVAQAVGMVGSWETVISTHKVEWSAQTHRIFETDPETYLPTHEGFLGFVHPDDREELNAAIAEAAERLIPFSLQHRIVMPDGRIKHLEERWQVFSNRDDGSLHATGTCQDVTAQKSADEALRLSETRQRLAAETLTAVQDALPAQIALIDPEGIIVAVNESWRRFADENRRDNQAEANYFLGSSYLGACDVKTGSCADEARVVREGLRAVLDGSLPVFEVEYPCHSPSENHWCRMIATPLRDDLRAGAVVMHINITDRTLAEQKLARLHRLYQVLSGTNTMIVRATSKDQLVREACRTAVRHGLFRMVAIFKQDDILESAHVMAFAGAEDGYLSEISVDVLHGALSRGTIGTCLRTGVYDVCNDIRNDPRMAPWREQALKRGYRSAASFPLRMEGRAAGAMVIFVEETDYFQADEIALLVSVAEDLSYAMAAMDQEQLRVQAEIALRSSETTMAIAQHIGQFGSWELELKNQDDPVANPLRWSAGMFRVAGLEPTAVAITNNLFFQLVHPDDRESIRLEFAAAIRERRQYSIVHRLIRPDGSERVLQETARVFYDVQTGQPQKMIGNAHDITEQRAAEEVLRESERRFRELAENIAEVFWITDPHTREMLYVNPSYERIWGYSCASLYSAPHRWLDSVHPDDRERAERASASALDGNYDEIYRIVRADGEIRWIHDRAYPVKNDAGEVYRLVGTAEDITARKVMEQQFLRAQRMDSIGSLASGIAHDLNNVLAPIMMSVELLRLRVADPRALDILEMIGSSAKRGAEMVGQVLSFGRGLEAGRVQVQVIKVIEDVVKIARETFPRNVRILLVPNHSVGWINADSTQLHQVFLNLCVNARDAMPDGGQITITAEHVLLDAGSALISPSGQIGPHVCIHVEDTGAGIPEELLGRIFDLFFTTKEVGKGTGLGLPSVLAIVNGHGGFIRVRSEPGQGSKFSVYLPTGKESALGSGNEIPSRPPQGNGETVLVVDDEVSICALTGRTLEAFGYTALFANDGAEAVAVYVENRKRIRVVLTDMMMPGMNGPALIRTLRAMEPGVKVIGSCGIADSDLVGEARTEGMMEFLAKPYSAEALLITLRKVLATDNGSELLDP